MRFHSASEASLRDMLRSIGVDSLRDLFRSIPEELQLAGPLELPGPLAELELDRTLRRLAARNRSASDGPFFLGAGAYHHFTTAAADHLIQRGEFLTTYTPYQAEMSQGTLQAIFEFQTLVCQLTEMEVANASLYDGATALAEAAWMAQRITGRSRVLLSRAIHPHYRQAVASLSANLGLQVDEFGHGGDGRSDGEDLRRSLGEDVAAVAVQSPNFFGCVEDLAALGGAVRSSGSLFVTAVAEAASLGLLAGPGRFGADIVVGEGQSLGIPLSFGGPYLGLMATRERHVRQMPGRLAGEARDRQGRRGFVLTLSTREQHIRREKATSNICTNQGLCALAATIHLCLLGPSGLRTVARRNVEAASFTRRRLGEIKGLDFPFSAPVFNEFVVRLPGPAAAFREFLAGHGVVAGLPLGGFSAEMEDCLLVCATEMTRRDDVEQLARGLELAIQEGVG